MSRLYLDNARFYFVRHGQTDWNLQGLLQGHADIALNEQGRQEAAQLKEHLAQIPFTACFSSDLKRAHETATIITTGRPLEVIKDINLRERNIGIFEGKTRKDYLLATQEELATVEAQEVFRRRMNTFLNGLIEAGHQGNVLIVSHGHFMRHLLAYKLNLPDHITALGGSSELKIENTAYYVAYYSDNEWVIEQYKGIKIPEF